VTNSRREFLQHAHLFNLCEPDDRTGIIRVGAHYSYPWPVPVEIARPSLAYIDSVYHLGGFEFWPAAWHTFWAEYELVQSGFDSGQGKYLHGPYLMLGPTHGVHFVCEIVAEIKRKARRDLVTAGGMREHVLRTVCQKLAPYLVPPMEVTRCESLT
jgi:hypothetical protein